MKIYKHIEQGKATPEYVNVCLYISGKENIMANNLTTLIKKLQMAINLTGRKLLYSTSQFYSEDQGRPITMYILHEYAYDKKKGKNVKVELFRTASQIQMLLYLRDMWEEVNVSQDSN